MLIENKKLNITSKKILSLENIGDSRVNDHKFIVYRFHKASFNNTVLFFGRLLSTILARTLSASTCPLSISGLI